MISSLLPDTAVAVEAFDDSVPAPLFDAEEELVRQAVDKRRTEFATARRCAREALAALGHPLGPLLRGVRGAPIWPAGVVGSITHCAGYRAAVVAPASTLTGVGIDAEPNEPLPPGVLASVARAEEARALDGLRCRFPGVRWDRLLFSAKESVYKTWFPVTGRWLDFHDAEVTFSPDTGELHARLLIDDPVVGGVRLSGLSGRWLMSRGLLLTAIALIPARCGSEPAR